MQIERERFPRTPVVRKIGQQIHKTKKCLFKTTLFFVQFCASELQLSDIGVVDIPQLLDSGYRKALKDFNN